MDCPKPFEVGCGGEGEADSQRGRRTDFAGTPCFLNEEARGGGWEGGEASWWVGLEVGAMRVLEM